MENLPGQNKVGAALAAKHILWAQVHGPGHLAKNFKAAGCFVGHARAHNVFKVSLRKFANSVTEQKGRHLEQQALQQPELRTALCYEQQLVARKAHVALLHMACK